MPRHRRDNTDPKGHCGLQALANGGSLTQAGVLQTHLGELPPVTGGLLIGIETQVESTAIPKNARKVLTVSFLWVLKGLKLGVRANVPTLCP